MCAGGLPGAEDLDIAKQNDWLDQAAAQVDLQARNHLREFKDSPNTYSNSLGYFCCNFLLRTLQELFGVKYNQARISDPSFQDSKCINPDFSDSRDLFIHGIIDGPGGTCASMPVLYVAVGRRLGYPLKLVQSRGHLFFRWDNPMGEPFGVPERFNIEATAQGLAFQPDEFYETWPEPWPEFDHLGGWYLRSLSPAGELSDFLARRGDCLVDNGRLDDAIVAYRWACGVSPHDARYWCQLETIRQRRGEQRRLERSAIVALEDMQHQRQQRDQLMSDLMPSQPRASCHGDSCKCFHCTQTRSTRQRSNLPGHPPGCVCSNCQQHSVPKGPTLFSPW
jgi:hypothetical protein